MKTDREELTTLRVSLARIAQVINVETDMLPVLELGYIELCDLAEQRERGWNDLAGAIVDHVCENKQATNPTQGDCEMSRDDLLDELKAMREAGAYVSDDVIRHAEEDDLSEYEDMNVPELADLFIDMYYRG